MSGFYPGEVRVRVPASSANLGPGFDTFGLALAMYDEATVRVTDGGITVDVVGEGAAAVPRDESNLVVTSILAAARRWHREPPGLHVRCRNTVPHSRGLGSSAAAIVAGVLAARELLPDLGIRDADVLALSAEMEGHPDNVAATLHGGLTLAWTDLSGAQSVRLDPHPRLWPVVCVPGWPMSTEAARRLLPDRVAYEDAVFNAARAGLLVAAVTQLPDLLFEATEDRLHQDHRASAMRPTAQLLSGLRRQGIPAVVSGSGPSVLALCRRQGDGRPDDHEGEALAVAELAGDDWDVEPVAVDLAGARTQLRGGHVE